MSCALLWGGGGGNISSMPALRVIGLTDVMRIVVGGIFWYACCVGNWSYWLYAHVGEGISLEYMLRGLVLLTSCAR